MSHPNTTSHPSPQRAGFTLVEIMIAMVILVIGILAVAGMMASSVQQTRRADNLSNSAMAALEKLDGFANMPFDEVTLGTHSDTVSFGPSNWVVEWTVEDVSASMALGSNQIKKITVRSGGGLGQRTAEVYELYVADLGGS
jgi:prepilin-type N-terminal cleavage/methylation domain-containing protein